VGQCRHCEIKKGCPLGGPFFCAGATCYSNISKGIGGRYSVRKESEVYDAYFDAKNHQLSVDNVCFLRDS